MFGGGLGIERTDSEGLGARKETRERIGVLRAGETWQAQKGESVDGSERYLTIKVLKAGRTTDKSS